MAVAQTAESEEELFETTGPDLDAPSPGLDDEDDVLHAATVAADKAGWEETAEDLREFRAVPEEERGEEWHQTYNQMMRTVQMIGGAVIGIAIVTIVVNEVLTTSAVNNSTGPFGGVITSLETTGVAAMSLLVVGLLVAAASKLMSFFGGGF